MAAAPSATAVRVAWELLEYTRAELTSLEENSIRVVGAQVAGLVALWTTLYTFDDGAPRALAWAAWGLILFSLAWLGRLVTPRRVARFWAGMPVRDVLVRGGALTVEDEVELMHQLATTMDAQIRRLRGGLVVAIVLGLAALGLAALGYIVDQV